MSDCQATLLGIGFGNNLNFGNVSELFLFSNGFPWVAKGVSEWVSEGFPWVSGGFLPDFTLGLFTMNYVFLLGFARPRATRLGFPNATEWPYYNITRLKLTALGECMGAGPVSSVVSLCPLEF